MSSTTVALLAGLVDGAAPDRGRIPDFVDALVAGDVDAEQVGAFLMAVRVLGLGREATVELTDAMARSGEVLSWQHLDGPVVDKHSTGGVGDPV
ncbi:MAG: thymidine phosphorylase, partial [Actinobacteria bacterium]|nr:thymidine phosphorylase [Actinomycetota bacterium]